MPRKEVQAGEATTSGESEATTNEKKPRRYKKSQLTRAALIAQDAEAARMKMDGKTYEYIADVLKYSSDSGAFDAVQRGLKRIASPDDMVAMRDWHVEQLKHMYDLLEPQRRGEMDELEITETDTLKGSSISRTQKKRQLEAIATSQKLLAEMRKYVPGLEVPVRQEVSGPDGGVPFQVVLSMPAQDPNTEVIDEDDLGRR